MPHGNESLHKFKPMAAQHRVAADRESGDNAAPSAANGDADAMKTPDQIVADVEAGMWALGWTGAEVPLADEAEAIERLFDLLDKPWFCRRHNVQFNLSHAGAVPVIQIVKGEMLAATWRAHGHALVFQPAGDGAEERAGTLDCAISITCDFLDHARIKPSAVANGKPRRASALA